MDLQVAPSPQNPQLTVAQPTAQPSLSVAQAPTQPPLSVQPLQQPTQQVPASQPTPPASKPSTLTNTINSLPPSPKGVLRFGDGTGINQDNQAVPVDPAVQSQNQTNDLNNASTTAHQGLNGLPPSNDDARSQLASNLIDSAMTNSAKDKQSLTDATTGANDLRTQTAGYYSSLGVSQAADDVAAARSALSQVQGEKLDNLSKNEQQLKGTGATEGDAQGQSQLDQRSIALRELGASIKLESATSLYNSKLDAFKVFSSSADTQQTHTISELSTQLGLDKQDLTAGVAVLNQIRQETQNNQQLAKQTFLNLISNVHGIASQLTPQEVQAIETTGNIPPSVVAKVGALDTFKDIQANQGQQKINATSALDYSKEVGTISDILIKRGITAASPEFQGLVSSLVGEMQSQNQTAGSTPTSTLSPGTGGSLVSSNQNPKAVVNGYDLTSYASGNAVGGLASQAANVQATLTKMPPTITDAATATSTIQSLKPNSPITGDAVMQAAQATGVDPRMIIAVANAESQLGTDGSKGSQQFNYGNVGNTDSLMASGGSVGLGNMQNGVMAIAQNLAKRQVNSSASSGLFGNSNSNSSGYEDITHNTSSDDVSGTKYIDLTTYAKSSPQYIAAMNYANQNGVFPVTDQKELTALQGLTQAKDTLSKMTELANKPGTFSNAGWYFGRLGQMSKQLETGPNSSGANQRQWKDYKASLLKNFNDVTGSTRVNSSNLSTLNIPSTITSSPADVKAWLDTMTQSLNSAEKSIVGKTYTQQPTTGTGLYLQSQFGGTPVGSSQGNNLNLQ
jgi:hypothetical protein